MIGERLPIWSIQRRAGYGIVGIMQSHGLSRLSFCFNTSCSFSSLPLCESTTSSSHLMMTVSKIFEKCAVFEDGEETALARVMMFL